MEYLKTRHIIYTVALFVLMFYVSVYSVVQSTYLSLQMQDLKKTQEKYVKELNVKSKNLALSFGSQADVLNRDLTQRNTEKENIESVNIPTPQPRPAEIQFRTDKCKTKDGLECDWCSTDYVNIESGKIKLQRCSDPTNSNPILDDIYDLSKIFGVKYEIMYKFLCSHKDAKFPDDRRNKIVSYINTLPQDKKQKADELFGNILKKKLKYLKVVEKTTQKASYVDYKECAFKGVSVCTLSKESALALDKYNKSCKTPSSSNNTQIYTVSFSGSDNSSNCSSLKNNITFVCSAKTSKSSSAGSGSAGQGGTGSPQTPSYTSPTPPNYPSYPTYRPQAPNQQYPYNYKYPYNSNYDPCKDPTFAQKNDMGFFTSLMFSMSCVFNSTKESLKDSKNNSSSTSSTKPISCTANVDKDTIQRGEAVKLYWTAPGARVVSIESDDVSKSSLPAKGEILVSPSTSTTYKITAENGNNKATCYASVTVENPGAAKLICDPTIVQKGQTVQVSWACPDDYALKDNDFGIDSPSGSKPFTLDSSRTFNLTCVKDEYTEIASCSVQVVEPQIEFIAYPSSVKKGGRVRLSWATLFMNACKVKGPYGFDYNLKNASILTVPFPTDDRAVSGDTREYTLSCTDMWGKEHTKTVNITLNDPDAYYIDEETINTKPDVIKTSLDPKECPHFTKYLKVGDIDDEVRKIQIFLKDQGLYYGPINGVFGSDLKRAIEAFQARYADEILKPWGIDKPTGYWYKTTRKKANYLAGCAEGAVVLDDGTVVY